ncbi:hypothetical protein C8A01DRAFT_44112 [Parachaetomium inaequale]|uniref:Ribonucleases P/MRP subunit Pop8-like domain-containing protein n=1 Tax=Parachaetomium inaequale TaxID=2588326 RepID=A0AAN6PL33_9PEZI|nr:hypothetical protein C8A01DRAFT_44112 [Parachaetomium inaequale]
MDLDPIDPQTTTPPPPPKPATPLQQKKESRTRTLTTTVLKHPPWSYARLELANPPAQTPTPSSMDMLQIRAYLTAATRQFLGAHGASIPLDILALRPTDGTVWVRVPRPDLGAFVAAVTAFDGVVVSSTGGSMGSSEQGEGVGRMVLHVKAAGDWLGSLIGKGEGEGALWPAGG